MGHSTAVIFVAEFTPKFALVQECRHNRGMKRKTFVFLDSFILKLSYMYLVARENASY